MDKTIKTDIINGWNEGKEIWRTQLHREAPRWDTLHRLWSVRGSSPSPLRHPVRVISCLPYASCILRGSWSAYWSVRPTQWAFSHNISSWKRLGYIYANPGSNMPSRISLNWTASALTIWHPSLSLITDHHLVAIAYRPQPAPFPFIQHFYHVLSSLSITHYGTSLIRQSASALTTIQKRIHYMLTIASRHSPFLTFANLVHHMLTITPRLSSLCMHSDLIWFWFHAQTYNLLL